MITSPPETAIGPPAYHGDPALKAATLAQMAAHRAADQLVKGSYWTNGKGCAVGCLTHDPSGGHAQLSTRWGIPEELVWLEDSLFESLPTELAMAWPERFLSAISPGADLSGVYAAWSATLMLDPDHGNVTRCGGFPDVEAAVRRVGELWQRSTGVTFDEWAAARSAAESASRSAESAWAARSAAESAARSAWAAAESAARSAESVAWAAESAAWAAESAARSAESAEWAARSAESAWAARSAAESAAWAAESAYQVWMADALIAALRDAPIRDSR